MKRYTKYFNILLVASVFASAYSMAQEERGGGDRPGRGGPPPFSQVDLDADGSLTLDEFQSENIPHGDHSEIFSSMDTDGDGVVSETEWSDHKPPKRGMREE